MKVIDRVGAFAVVLLAVGLASCVSIEQPAYPTDWSPVVAGTGTCSDVTGTYANSGPGPVLLAKWILPKTTASLERIERVQLAGPRSGSITVRLIEGSSVEVAVRVWKEGIDYRCENGWLVLSLESVVIPPFGYFKAARLARTVDRQLVVESTQTTFGLAPAAPLVPVAHHDSKWHRYPLVAE
jgi:hypothetical protein